MFARTPDPYLSVQHLLHSLLKTMDSWQGAQSKDGIIGRGRFVGLTAMDAGA